MRILHVDHSPVLGGAERSVLELARAQIAMGHEIVVGVGRAGDFSDALAAASVPWRDLAWPAAYVRAPGDSGAARLLRAGPDVARAAMSLRRACAAWRPDVVQVHTRKAHLISSLALTGTRFSMVWHLRDDVPRRRVIRAALRVAMRRVDHAVALSDWIADHHRTERMLPRSGRIGIVASGIDASGLAGLETPWLDGAPVATVGFVGQIARWKGPHLLIDAAERLEHRQDLRFRIVGSVMFPDAEAEYGRWLEERLARSPARDRIEWSGSAKGPRAAFSAIDVLAHTSIEPEPFGRVIVEAMAARRCLVLLRHGSSSELADETCATFANGMDGPALAEAIDRATGDRDAAARKVAAGVERASRFSPDAVARAMEHEYGELHLRVRARE